MSVKIDHITLHKGEHIFIRFAGCVEHAITVFWSEKDDLPTVSGPSNCKAKKFSVSIHGMELILEDDEN